MNALDRKLFREVIRLRGQALTIAVVVASGVACYISLQSAWRALYESRDLYYETNRFADVFAHLGPIWPELECAERLADGTFGVFVADAENLLR